MFGVGKSDGIPFDKVLPEETTVHIFTYIGLEAIQNAPLFQKIGIDSAMIVKFGPV